jgi:hypothetical protein
MTSADFTTAFSTQPEILLVCCEIFEISSQSEFQSDGTGDDTMNFISQAKSADALVGHNRPRPFFQWAIPHYPVSSSLVSARPRN